MKLIERISSLPIPKIGLAGLSGTGKTTLMAKLVRKFAENNISVGYIKHDGHRFEMDREGKDTDVARKSGATPVLINS